MKKEFVYIRYDMEVEGFNARPTMLSIHKTLDGAIEAIPESIKNDSLKREPYADFVVNYTYEAVRKIELQA